MNTVFSTDLTCTVPWVASFTQPITSHTAYCAVADGMGLPLASYTVWMATCSQRTASPQVAVASLWVPTSISGMTARSGLSCAICALHTFTSGRFTAQVRKKPEVAAGLRVSAW